MLFRDTLFFLKVPQEPDPIRIRRRQITPPAVQLSFRQKAASKMDLNLDLTSIKSEQRLLGRQKRNKNTHKVRTFWLT